MQKTEKFSAEITKQIELDYLLSLPKQYDNQSSTPYPLILYLHGAQMREDGVAHLHEHGVPRRATSDQSFPFVVVAPHCPPNLNWTYLVDHMKLLLDEIEKTYHVDTARIYITGLSMGGGGSWHFAATLPERFAAMVSVCAYYLEIFGFPDKAQHLKNIPVWAFHGTDDDIVPISDSQKLVEALEQAGGNVRLTEMRGRGHDIWEDVYQSDEVYKWLLQHTNSHRQPGA